MEQQQQQQPPPLEVRPHPSSSTNTTNTTTSTSTAANKGRGLYATAAFRPGAVIHVFAEPALLLPSLPHLALVCAHCLRPGTPRACTRCRAAYYCDAKCQADAWAAGHARECKALRRRQHQAQQPQQQQLQQQQQKQQPRRRSQSPVSSASASASASASPQSDAVPDQQTAPPPGSAAAKKATSAGEKVAGRSGAELPTPVRALVQALLREDLADALDTLEGHAQHRRELGGAAEWRDMEIMAMAGCAFAGKPVNEKEVRRAVDLLCKIQTNAFHRYDADLGQVGIFLEPTLAMANHSCVPNAMVQFIGRAAVLRAERNIEEGDEVEISYTDYTYPYTMRKEALAQYCFECRCPRCKDNLNVYQVCAANPVDAPCGTSLASDASAAAESHSAVTDEATLALAKSNGESATRLIEDWSKPDMAPNRRIQLRAQYSDCRGLVGGELWAVTPVPQVLTEISIFYAEKRNFAFALAVACLVATRADPYRYVAWFHLVRVKNLFMIAKLLAHTAERSASLSSVMSPPMRANMDQQAQVTLQDIDQAALCQMLLHMILRAAPAGVPAEWDLVEMARDMLEDIESLPGREKEMSLINAWIKDPASETSKIFFDFAVVQQVNALASLGTAALKMDFGIVF
ncbi:SET domain-containing protein [Purpureocillium lavendulum]|uniref:SET domain-containing protein n=1 Tax=Purpureocillium lavendulum TaxID=1247861 RepID=A0AB34G4U8_9HYPO|nr:SET domain-containing protein [Purpureocillium lavendulum]